MMKRDFKKSGDSVPPGTPLSFPAWSGSVLFHVCGLLVLFFVIRPQPEIRGAPGVMETKHIGIVLKTDSRPDAQYANAVETFDADSGKISESQHPSNHPVAGEVLTGGFSSLNPEQFLPKSWDDVIGLGHAVQAGSSGTGFTPGNFADPITSGGTSGVAGSSKATIGVFGLQGTGQRFAFVFDRSASMSEFGGLPIRAAKAELIRALGGLRSTHELIIIFYNNRTSIYPEADRAVHMAYATDISKEAASRFVNSMVPEGGTDHEQALVTAAKTRPDVIFLLTDGESKDDLNAAQSSRINRAVAGIQLNVVQFGVGSEHPGRNALKTLALQNAGLYQYVDVKQFTP